MPISNVQNVKIAFKIVFLRDTECSFDKKIICIFMVSSPFSFQKSIPTWEICYFERKSTRNRSHRIMNFQWFIFLIALLIPFAEIYLHPVYTVYYVSSLITTAIAIFWNIWCPFHDRDLVSKELWALEHETFSNQTLGTKGDAWNIFVVMLFLIRPLTNTLFLTLFLCSQTLNILISGLV